MKFTNLDIIARRWCLEKGLPIHYYLEALVHASTALRELAFDTIGIINTVRLPLNDYAAVDTPSDFVDEVAVSLSVGNYLLPVSKNNNITPLRNKNSDGAFTTYGEDGTVTFDQNGLWFWNTNDWGENTGRMYGGSGATQSGYKVFPERRQIQFTEGFPSASVVLMYISDGQNMDAATMIDVRAQMTIQAFMSWKRSPNADNNRSPEAANYYNEKRLLKQKLNDLTINDVKDIMRRNFHASIKN